MGQALLFASGKGGTGKTSVTAGLGSALCARGHRVLLVDCDIAMRNLELVLGLTDQTSMNFFDVAMERVPLGDAVSVHPKVPGLHLLNCPGTLPEEIPSERRMKALKEKLKSRYDFILVDAPAGLGLGLSLGMLLADEAVLVTTPDRTSCRDASIAAQMLREKGLPLRLLINRVRPREIRRGDAPDLDSAMDMVGCPLLGIIPEDPRVRASGNRSEVESRRRRISAARAFDHVAGRMCGEAIPLMKIGMGGNT